MTDDVTEISDGLAILRALEGFGGRPFDWVELGMVVIDRGAHAIFPLAVVEVRDDHDPVAPSHLREMAQSLEQDCIHFYGGDWFHAETVLDLDTGFGRRLVETTMLTRPPRYWWSVGRFAAVIVRSVEERREFETLALHIIPKDWVRDSPITPSTKRDASRLRRTVRERETVAGVADVVWSWPLEASHG